MLTGEKKWGLRRVLSPAWHACPMSGRPMDSPDDSFDNREKNEASDPVAPTPPSSVLRPTANRYLFTSSSTPHIRPPVQGEPGEGTELLPSQE